MFALIGLFTFGVMLIPSSVSTTFASIYTLLPAAVTMTLYGISWSIQRELKIPAAVMGTAIGISSCIGWLPDLFMHTMFGHWLDIYGNTGYRFIFSYLIVLSIIGFLCGFVVQRSNSKRKAEEWCEKIQFLCIWGILKETMTANGRKAVGCYGKKKRRVEKRS